MLTAKQRGFFRVRFDVLDAADQLVASLRPSWAREAASLDIDGVTYGLGRDGWLSGDFCMRRGNEVIAAATKPSAFRRSFQVQFGKTLCTLEAKSPVSGVFLFQAGDRALGEIRPRSLWSRHLLVDLPESMPLEIRVFLAWLVILLRKRQQHAGGAGE